MALEEALNENTSAVRALTALMSGKPGAAAVAGAAVTGPTRGPGRPKKVTLAEVKAIAEKVRDEPKLGRPQAVALIQQHGAKSLADLDESKYAAFVAAAEVLLNSTEGEEEEPGEEAEAEL